MKYLLLLFLALTVNSCDKNDDDDGPQDPISQLPPATQVGANTFGALLDGEPFIPSGGINPLDCVYQLIDGEYYFAVQGNKRDENFDLFSLSLTTNAKSLETGQTYELKDRSTGNVSGLYSFRGTFFNTTTENFGQLTITKLDLNSQIISGTFFYDVIDGNGNLREIRDGRFDMRFTQ
jgi:hypothetical protein